MNGATSDSPSHTRPRVGLIQVHPNAGSTDPQSLRHFEIDIIAIHGLDAETPKTWLAWEDENDPNSTKINWLQDNKMLPSLVPRARVLTYQWNARYDEVASTVPFESQAFMLLDDIYNERFFSEHKRPIIFIASCFGGLLLARALVSAASPLHAARGGNSAEVLRDTVGVIFLGTPFRSSDPTGRAAAKIRYEAALASGKACSPNLLQYLRQGSMHESSGLDELVVNFQSLINHRNFKFDITCAYETLTTKTSVYKSKLGNRYEEFARGRNAEFVVVDHNSARLGGTKELPLDVRHNMLHKFNSPDDPSFRKIAQRLREIIDQSDQIMAQKEHNHILTRRNSQAKREKPEEWQAKYLEALDFDGIDYQPQQFREPGDTACKWLIEDPSYSKWYDDGHGTFWILGHAGTGKSTLIKQAIKRCEEQAHQDRTVVLSFFFHNQGKLLQRTSEGLFRALLHQLIEKLPHQMRPFAEKLDLKKSRLNQVVWEDRMSVTNSNEPIWPAPYLMKHFEDSVEELVERFDIRIFVDALDECKDKEWNDEETADVYNLVLKMQEITERLCSKPRKFSICFACRRYPQLARLDRHNHVFVEHGNGKDIEEYVCRELEREITGEEYKDRRETLKDEILKAADRNFLWVTIVVPKLLMMNRGGRADLIAELHKIPQRIEDIFATAISSLPKETRPLSLKFFQWVCFATRPLDVSEIRFAINIIPEKQYRSFDDLPQPLWGNTDEDMENLVCTLSGGLAEVRVSGEVFFIHQSVKDYMIRSGFCCLDLCQSDTQQVLKGGHYLLLNSCLWWMAESTMSKASDRLLDSFSEEIIHTTFASLPAVTDDFFDNFDISSDISPDISPENIRLEIDALSESERQGLREAFKQTTTRNWDSSLPEDYSQGSDWSQFDEWLFVDEVLACYLFWITILFTTPSALGYMYAVGSWTDHAVQCLTDMPESIGAEILRLGLDLFFSRAQPTHIFLHNHVFITLHRVAMASSPVVLRELLEQDSDRSLDVNLRSADDMTPLMGALEEGASENVQVLLKRNDVEVDAEDINNKTALLMAIESKNYSIAELLINNNADINHQDNKGLTALMYAVQGDKNEIVDLLLEHGARTDIEDNNDLSAVDHATDTCFSRLRHHIIQKVKRQEMELK
ncbi:ankyrin repeat [Fusarium sp. NRRL 25303]|nr:ankyrin repeat [Fusarium sp. NRRL 25303]